MSYIDLLYLYDLILIAIVGSYMAVKVLRKWATQIRKMDAAAVAAKATAKVAKVNARRKAKMAKATAKFGDVVDGARDAAADALRDTADAVDSDTTT